MNFDVTYPSVDSILLGGLMYGEAIIGLRLRDKMYLKLDTCIKEREINREERFFRRFQSDKGKDWVIWLMDCKCSF